MLFDESHCIFQGIFNDVAELWVDPGIRDYYVEPYPAIHDCFMKSKVTQGSFIWCWGDDLFCVPGRGFEYGRQGAKCHFVENSYRLPGRGIVGDAPWGVVDGWRRKKPEFWITKKLHSPVKIKETALALPAAGEPINVPVENQYDFSNLSELKIHWTLGDQKRRNPSRRARRDPPARWRSSPAGPSKTAKSWHWSSATASGQLVDTYRVPLGPRTVASRAGHEMHAVAAQDSARQLAGRACHDDRRQGFPSGRRR